MSNKTTLSEQIYQELFHDITTQKLIFGQKLTLHDLKNRFQVSQTPVREALKIGRASWRERVLIQV